MSINAFKGILIAIFLAAILVPVGIDILVGVDTSGWDPTLVTIWNNLPLIIGIVVLIGFVSWIGVSRSGRFGVAAPILPVLTNDYALFSVTALIAVYLVAKTVWGYRHRKIPTAIE